MTMLRKTIGAFLLALTSTAALAQAPTTTKPNISTMGLTNCTVDQLLFGGGSVATPVCSGSGTNGQIMVGQTGAAPLFKTITGDVTFTAAGASALGNIPNDTTAAGDILFTNITAPSAPASGKVRAYTTPGDQRLHDINQNGVVGTTVIASTCGGGAFANSVSAAGVISCGTPAGGSTTGPTSQLLVTATPSSTYTTPASVKWIEVFMVGGGGGGLGSGSGPSSPGNGGSTCWNTSGTACTTPLYSATGGIGGIANGSNPGSGGTGGGVGGSATCNDSSSGTGGSPGQNSPNSVGGAGGGSVMGGGAASSVGSAVNAAANSGAGGGGGGSSNSAIISGAGGGGGGYCRFIINSPSASYVFTNGAGGGGGTSGAGGLNGGNGGTGRILVVEHYNF